MDALEEVLSFWGGKVRPIFGGEVMLVSGSVPHLASGPWKKKFELYFPY